MLCSLAVLAWVGQQVHNLFLTYLVGKYILQHSCKKALCENSLVQWFSDWGACLPGGVGWYVEKLWGMCSTGGCRQEVFKELVPLQPGRGMWGWGALGRWLHLQEFGAWGTQPSSYSRAEAGGAGDVVSGLSWAAVAARMRDGAPCAWLCCCSGVGANKTETQREGCGEGVQLKVWKLLV